MANTTNLAEKLLKAQDKLNYYVELEKNIRFRMGRLNDSYMENRFGITPKQFNTEMRKLERLLKQTQLRIEKTLVKIRSINAQMCNQ